ncbi:hypothetical protein H8B09_26660 [Paenibacillus sp. PR3]|uniref:Copper amine oxidase-like N-terminal domain-containing protein n=1 Tax=Paenibacillus terricola TaxID=2763503 RepID=A0ABR8N2H0_9BACL|nr:hypothetical protein [Paenibacillus terricola]MBD3922363.1 hypothetical protein [Paenibacillus terricola]
MKKNIAYLLIGFLAGALLFNTLAADASSSIKTLISHPIKHLFINYNKYDVQESDQLINYNGKTYVQLRFMTDTLGQFVSYDSASKSIHVYFNPCNEYSYLMMPQRPDGVTSVREERTLCINNKALLLPADAFLDGVMISDGVGVSEHLPAFMITRWHSTITIGRTGVVIRENIGEQDKEPFNFLKPYITDYLK